MEVINSSGYYQSNVKSTKYGKWWANSKNPHYIAAHESGHFFDLRDDYKKNGPTTLPNPGHKGHLMASYGGVVAQHEIDDIMKQTSCSCK